MSRTVPSVFETRRLATIAPVVPPPTETRKTTGVIIPKLDMKQKFSDEKAFLRFSLRESTALGWWLLTDDVVIGIEQILRFILARTQLNLARRFDQQIDGNLYGEIGDHDELGSGDDLETVDDEIKRWHVIRRKPIDKILDESNAVAENPSHSSQQLSVPSSNTFSAWKRYIS